MSLHRRCAVRALTWVLLFVATIDVYFYICGYDYHSVIFVHRQTWHKPCPPIFSIHITLELLDPTVHQSSYFLTVDFGENALGLQVEMS